MRMRSNFRELCETRGEQNCRHTPSPHPLSPPHWQEDTPFVFKVLSIFYLKY
jgi:hypothetical protein